ncbi:hypothetical protein JI664_00355 [Rhodobacter sp. NTK016B]|uniref:hypothetical protein n=1 Tax=Rhodobacter sp. NTK016B TaxID=2759676 RepID=UPI001A906CD3|nr:hypothetical protein [Rhodobacter sp. NTK016B]MBN8290406.1 hypothetical protein [Rhodobacter sp. NTK016B]
MTVLDTNTPAATRTMAPRRSTGGRLLDWLFEIDANFRQKMKLRDMPDERLADMGLTRADVARAFTKSRVGVIKRARRG